MTDFKFVSEPAADRDLESAYDWYEHQREGLGLQFLEAVRAVYDRISSGPFQFQVLRSGIRRALTKRFPYAVYFAVEGDTVVVLAVLHVSRDPEEWQKRSH